MADEIKVYPDVDKGATASGSNCATCAGYGLKHAIITPCKLTYKVKITFYTDTKPGDSPDRVYITPMNDVSYKMELMSLMKIEDGAYNKDPYEEWKNYYNAHKDPSAPNMTTEDATKMLKEVAKELKKTDYKGMIEKSIKNHLDPKQSKGKLAFDQACTSMIEQKVIDKISYKGWTNFKSTSVEYLVEANLGVDGVFMQSCANVTDKSKLTISSPAEKTCKSFVLGINKDKSNGIFCFEPKEPYDGDGKFVGRMRSVADAEKMFTPQYSENNAIALHVQEIKLARQATKDGMMFGDSGIRKVVRAGSFDVVAGSQVTAGFRFGVGNDGENLFAGQDIGINFKFRPDSNNIMETTGEVLVGGRFTSCAMAAKLIVRVIKNSVEIVVQALTQPNRKGDQAKEQARILAENAAKALASAEKQKADALAAAAAFKAAQDKLNAEAAAAALAAANALIASANAAKIDSDNLKNGTGGTILKADIPQEADTTHGKVIEDITQAKGHLIDGNMSAAVDEANNAKTGSIDLKIAAKTIDTAAKDLKTGIDELVDKGQENDKDLLDLNYVAYGKLDGVSKYLSENIPDMVKKVDESNGETIGGAVAQLIVPELTPLLKTPPETVVEKSDLDPNATVPTIKTTPGDSKSGQIIAKETPSDAENNKDKGPSFGTLGGNGLETPKKLPTEGDGEEAFKVVKGEEQVGFSFQKYSADKYKEPNNQDQLKDEAP